MKKTPLILITLLMIHYGALAQMDEPSVEKHQTVYHIPLAFSHEFGVGRKSTIQLAAAVGLGLAYTKSSYLDFATMEQRRQEYYSIEVFPAVSGTYRYYYNLGKRQRKGKRTDRNSGNFFGFEANLAGPSIVGNEAGQRSGFSGSGGPVWGFQRNYGKRFNLQVSVGGGVGSNGQQVYFTPLGGASVGFRLGKN